MVFLEQDPNARFEKAIFNLLRNFNYIELNVGLCIASIPGEHSRQEKIKRLSKLSFNEKMKWFRSLLEDDPLRPHLGEEGILEFQNWYLRAQDSRELRNQYVHGIWDFNPMVQGSPVSISSPEWMKDILGDKLHETMSLDELDSKVSMIETVFNDFWELRTRYRI